MTRGMPQFTGPELWSPYGFKSGRLQSWDVMQKRVYRTAMQDVDDLKQHLIAAWSRLKHSVIDEAIGQWCKRLWACVNENGLYFEHLL